MTEGSARFPRIISNSYPGSFRLGVLISSLFLGTIVSTVAASAESSTQGNNSDPPYATIDPQTVTFDLPTIEKNPVAGEYDWLTIDDCEYISQPGHPALPYKAVVFKANLGYEISGVTVDIASEDLDGIYNITPALEASQFGTEGGSTDPDPAIYSSEKPYPGNWYSYDVKIGIDSETMTRIKYVIVHLYPLQYEPASGKIVRAEKATVEVNYSGSPINPPFSATDLLIITSPRLESQANDLRDFRNAMGISTIVKTTSWIYANYPAPPLADNQESIREYIKTISGLKYMVIFGDADQVPVRYIYDPIQGYAPTDLYYADLDGTWDADGDGLWGEPVDDNIDGMPDLYIGRLPADTTVEATILVNKIKDYEQNTSLTDIWFKKVLLLGTDPFIAAGAEGEILKNYIESQFITPDYTVTKLYETDSTLTVANVTTEINAGYGLVNFAGHGNYDVWGFGIGGAYYNADASGQTNGSNLPAIFAMSCSTSRFDDQDCIGEAFMLNPDGGAIAYFGSTRVAWGYVGSWITTGLAGEMDWQFCEEFFSGERIAGKVWGEAIKDYVTAHSPTTYYSGYGYLDWWTTAEYGSPFMDPTLYIGGSRPIATTINTSGLVSAYQATISYMEAGVPQTANTYGTWSGTPDYNTTLSISNPVSASATERYYTTDTTWWTVIGPTTHSVTYYHQFSVTITTNGLNPSYPATITVVQCGATNNPTTSATWSDWADSGSTLSISSAIIVSTPGRTVQCSTSDTTSWTVNSAITATVNYTCQFWIALAESLGIAHSFGKVVSYNRSFAENASAVHSVRKVPPCITGITIWIWPAIGGGASTIGIVAWRLVRRRRGVISS